MTGTRRTRTASKRGVADPDAWRTIALPDQVGGLITAHTAFVHDYALTKLQFTFDGRLVGDLAEATVAEAFGLELCRVRTPGVDAHAPDGTSVQIKASGVGRGPALTPGEARADHLIFPLFDYVRAEAGGARASRNLSTPWTGRCCASRPAR